MSLFDDAARFAVEAHADMTRKGGGLPYILHPFEVATIAASMTSDEEVLAAALLHDVVEDAGVDFNELRERFGNRVADLVASETENKYPGVPKSQTWHRRKAESLEQLATATDDGVRILWVSDKLANMRSLWRMVRREGDAAWSHFNQADPSEHAWYYTSVAKYTSQLSATDAWQELDSLVSGVFSKETE